MLAPRASDTANQAKGKPCSRGVLRHGFSRHPLSLNTKSLACRAQPDGFGARTDLVAGVGSNTSPVTSTEAPSILSNAIWGVPVALVGLVIFAKILKASKGSVSHLEQRGLLDSDRKPNSATPWDADTVGAALNKVKYMDYSPLTDDQILKQRKRRQMERDVVEVKLEEIAIPENHPWATSAADDDLTDEMILDRLSLKRGIPRNRMDGQQAQSKGHEEEASTWQAQDVDEQHAMRQRAQRRAQQNMDRMS